MSDIEIDFIGKKVKILNPKGYHHNNEVGVLKGRDSMPPPGSRCVWWVEARGSGNYYSEEDLELLDDEKGEGDG